MVNVNKKTTILISSIVFLLATLGIWGKLDEIFVLIFGIIAVIFTGIISIIPALIFIGIYLIPLLVAVQRKHSNKTPIILVSIFFGWTIIGWIIALIWATTDNTNL